MSIELTYLGSKKPPPSLAMGVFDGIHQGHQALLSQCTSLLTFDPHPVTLVKNISTVQRLTTLKEMNHYMKNMVVLHFNSTIQHMSATSFFEEIIVKRIKPQKIIIGYDYHFGKNRSGTPTLLQQLGKQHNIDVTIVNPIRHNQTIVKSRQIRALIQNDQFNEAVAALGHPYLMIGTVIKGENRGKKLGFPTANLEFPGHKLIPNNGVYSGHVMIKKSFYKAMIYIGKKPTFNHESTTIEVFILDFKGNLYNKNLTVFIEKFIRHEKKFSSEQALITQINNDIKTAHDN